MIIDFYSATKLGDKVTFDSKLLLTKEETLTFSTTITGTTADSYFTKYFRYALDGVHFNTWLEITQPNLDILTQLLTEEEQKIWLQFQYIYSGTVEDVLLTITAVSINGNSMKKDYQYVKTNNTIFGVYINDWRVFDLMNNLSEKLFDLGIVPAYVERGDEYFALNVDEDYIDFWTSVAHYYALYFVYCLQFTDIFNQQKLLCEFLRQKNLFFCSCGDFTLLRLLAKNYYSEIRARGTYEILRKKGFQYPIGQRNSYSVPNGYDMVGKGVKIDGMLFYDVDLLNSLPDGWIYNSSADKLFSPDCNYYRIEYYNSETELYDIAPTTIVKEPATIESGIYKKYNGELLRLVCFDENCDEFFYINTPLQFTSWNLNNSSPMYRGLRMFYTEGFIKAYEDTFNFVNLDKYPLLTGFEEIAEKNISYLDKNFIESKVLSLTNGQGIGYKILGANVEDPDITDTYEFDEKYAITISPKIDYEISFWLNVAESEQKGIELSAMTFNCDLSLRLPTIDIQTGESREFFIRGSNTILQDEWVFVRFVLYGQNQQVVLDRQPMTSLAMGTNLILDERARKLIVRVAAIDEGTYIWNFKVKPLRTDFSRCFLDSRNLLMLFLKNNNKTLTSKQIEQTATRYLLPYNYPQSKFVFL